LQSAFRPIRAETIRGRHIVLIDDVLTTGATLEVAARTLKRAGAKRVSAIVLAQA
jgi:predicted amidophosphoribosyltransferase